MARLPEPMYTQEEWIRRNPGFAQLLYVGDIRYVPYVRIDPAAETYLRNWMNVIAEGRITYSQNSESLSIDPNKLIRVPNFGTVYLNYIQYEYWTALDCIDPYSRGSRVPNEISSAAHWLHRLRFQVNHLKRTANERSIKLFESLVSRKQSEQFWEHGYFDLVCQSGITARITCDASYNIFLYHDESHPNKPTLWCCAGPDIIHKLDIIAAQKLALQYNQDLLLSQANYAHCNDGVLATMTMEES